MESTKFYIVSKDGQDISDLVTDARFTLPKNEQDDETPNYAEPFSVTLDLKVNDETVKALEKMSEDFDKEREKGIKTCAEHCGITEDEMRQILEGYERYMGARMIPKIKNETINK